MNGLIIFLYILDSLLKKKKETNKHGLNIFIPFSTIIRKETDENFDGWS